MDGLATSLDAEEGFDLHPEWRAEIERRVERIVTGKAKGTPMRLVQRVPRVLYFVERDGLNLKTFTTRPPVPFQ
jgi:hypothetical protein